HLPPPGAAAASSPASIAPAASALAVDSPSSPFALASAAPTPHLGPPLAAAASSGPPAYHHAPSTKTRAWLVGGPLRRRLHPHPRGAHARADPPRGELHRGKPRGRARGQHPR